jgi:hypothetical protein
MGCLMSLSHLLEHIEPIEISGRVAQAVGVVVRDYDPMTIVTGMVDASLAMQHGVLYEP